MNIHKSFDMLSIPTDASLDEAKNSYKRMVRRWHPDQFGEDPEKQQFAQEKLKEINVAYRDIVAYINSRSGKIPAETKTDIWKRRPPAGRPEKHLRQNIFSRMVSILRSASPDSRNSVGAGLRRQAKNDSGHGDGTEKNIWRRYGDSDFDRLLSRALKDQPRGGAKKKGETGKGRGRRSRSNYTTSGRLASGPFSSGRRGRGDRIEKISPVRPVRKI